MGACRGWIALLAMHVAGCLGTDSSVCASGRACPTGAICVDTLDRCVDIDVYRSCRDRDGALCEVGGIAGRCSSGDCVFACGDGLLQLTQEECDGATDLKCTDVGYYGGELSCSATCTLDESKCAGFCGDGLLSANELCEPSNFPSQCASAGVGFGLTSCADTCIPDVSECRALGSSRSGYGDPLVTYLDAPTLNSGWALDQATPAVHQWDGVTWRQDGGFSARAVVEDFTTPNGAIDIQFFSAEQGFVFAGCI